MNRIFNILSCCIVIGALAFGGIPSAVLAQYNLPNIPSGTLTLEVSNQSPKAGEQITARVLSYSVDLNRSTITWYLGGKVAQTGVGLNTYTFTAGNLGTNHAVSVHVRTPDGITLEQSVAIKTAEVDIIWEASSYTPPFYKGKSLYPYQGEVVVAAIPHFSDTPINPKNYIYSWKINGTAHADISGYGKDSIVVTGSVIARPIEVEVTVSSSDGATTAFARTTIEGREPEVLFYEDSQLYGLLYNRALTDFELKNKEITLTAAPYFFTTPQPHTSPNIAYNWQINGRTVLAQNNGTDSLVLRRPDNQAGQSQISVKITNNAQLLQFANAQSTIYFSE